MRKYITEKVGILELFQIIFTALVLCLGYYAFFIDVSWNHRVEKHGIQLCFDINHEILRESNKTALMEAECADINEPDEAKCWETIRKEHLNEQSNLKFERPKPFFPVDHNGEKSNKKKFILTNMKRRQASEVSFLVISTLIAFLLVMHMILASFMTAIEIRTKWNAIVQGIILFAAGFSAMLLAISTNSIDNKYIILYGEIRMCDMLRFCDRTTSNHPEVEKESHLVLNRVLDSHHACQAVKIKEAICILLIIILGTSVTMIFLAMDLVTTYEQESEEEEVTILETAEEEENMEFDADGDTNDDSATEATDHPPKRKTALMHGRASDAVLKEFLHHHHHDAH